MANFKRYTRYTNGKTYTNRENKNFLILRPPLNLPQDTGDTTVVINQELINRPDLIAQAAYGNPDLWWVIFEYNGIIDPLFDLKVGQSLTIPDINRVTLAISQLGKV